MKFLLSVFAVSAILIIDFSTAAMALPRQSSAPQPYVTNLQSTPYDDSEGGSASLGQCVASAAVYYYPVSGRATWASVSVYGGQSTIYSVRHNGIAITEDPVQLVNDFIKDAISRACAAGCRFVDVVRTLDDVDNDIFIQELLPTHQCY